MIITQPIIGYSSELHDMQSFDQYTFHVLLLLVDVLQIEIKNEVFIWNDDNMGYFYHIFFTSKSTVGHKDKTL